ncbi:MAG: hypothetical protein IIC41_02650, partial [Candidatus Marinimicrobia bacterium]|nr:hypothetical protein [Candidatus Neomarinimicrobiota bacterium]
GDLTLILPRDNAVDVCVQPNFQWTAATQAAEYSFEIATDSGFTNIVETETGLTDTGYTIRAELGPLSTYYWRVRATNACGVGNDSAIFSFTTLDTPPILLVDDDDNGPDVRSTYTNALDALGMSYDVWDTNNSDNEPDAATLAPYEVVIWFTGDEFGGSAGPGSAGESALGSYLDSGRYRLAVVEGGLADFPAGINRRRYALSSEEALTVQGDTVQVRMLLSSPLTQPQIQSLEWATPTYLAITFDTPFGEAPPPAGLYATQNAATWGYVVLSPDSDSTVVDLGEGYTQLGEPYRIEPFVLPGPTMEDTLRPRVIVKGNLVRLEPVAVAGSRLITTARGLVTFSEPVRLPEGLMARVMGRDTLQVPLLQDTPLSASLEVYEPERYKRAQFLGGDITDYAGNPLADSLVSVKLVFQLPQSTGEISGRIIGLAGTVVVEVREVETGRRVAHAVTDTAGYHIGLVPPGFYHLFAHEQVGRSPLPYYSGSWEPYRPAAPFASYPDPVEVRPRWEVGGVDINFNVALDTTQEVPADRKD